MKSTKNKHLADYIYIRIGKESKKALKERAKLDGSNMTIWVRQLILKTLLEDDNA